MKDKVKMAKAIMDIYFRIHLSDMPGNRECIFCGNNEKKCKKIKHNAECVIPLALQILK